jgi:hypothetical protein
MNPAFVYPMAAMFLLTAVVTCLMLRERIAEIKARQIRLKTVASSTQMNAVMHNTRAADNYKNLFEMPVFFYVFCLVAASTAAAPSQAWLWGAWLYVALRVVHSAIHVGYNRVIHRFWAFLASNAVLMVLWLSLLLRLLNA